jgi:four helix bundle protein
MTLLSLTPLSDAGISGEQLLCTLIEGYFRRIPFSEHSLRKTLLSVYSNFGEGFERDGNREFAQFVSIAKGSIGEIRAQLIYALDCGYLRPEVYSDLDQLGKTAAACLGGLIRHLNNSSYRGRKFKQRENLRMNPNANLEDQRRTLNAEGQTPNAER